MPQNRIPEYAEGDVEKHDAAKDNSYTTYPLHALIGIRKEGPPEGNADHPDRAGHL